MWRYTADLLFILENPLLRDVFFPTTEHLYFIDAARPEEGRIIDALLQHREPPAAAAILGAWWHRVPHAFRVVREGSDAVAGFSIVATLDRVPHAILEADPVARRWLDDLRHRPVPRGQRVLLDRLELASDDGPSQPAVLAAILLDLKRMYMELRPDLRRIYTSDREFEAPGSVWARVGVEPMAGGPTFLDGIAYFPAVLDFGPASVDGWLTRVIATELQIEEDSILDVAQDQLVLADRRVTLTKLEFEVFKYLNERPGHVVERASLLRDVWRYACAGGSNVMEALVKTPRRKLGNRSAAIQPVRGLGYDFTATG